MQQDAGNFGPPSVYTPGPPPAEPGSGKAVAALVLGLVGLLAWCIPLFGLPVGIVGLVLGISARRTARRGMATAGIVLCILTLVATTINGAYGAYQGATGRNPLVNMLQGKSTPAQPAP